MRQQAVINIYIAKLKQYFQSTKQPAIIFREKIFGIQIYNTRLHPKIGITAIQTAVNFALSSNIDTRQYLRAKANIINLAKSTGSRIFHRADFGNRIANI